MSRAAAVALARRWWPVGLLAAVGLLVGVAWWRVGPGGTAPGVGNAVVSAPDHVAAIGPAATADTVAAKQPATASPASASAPRASQPASVPAAAPRAAAPKVVRVCGGARVRVGADGEPDEAAVEALFDASAAKPAALARLDAGDELSTAVADYLGWHSVWLADARARSVATPASAAADHRPNESAAGQEARARLARLIATAAATSDARIYGLALRSCRSVRTTPPVACGRLSLARWAQLDPGNAAIWIEALNDASAQGDAQAVGDALHRMATATRVDTGFGLAAFVLLAEQPRDGGAALSAYALALEAISADAVVTMPSLAPLHSACRGATLADPNRRETCTRIAELLLDKADVLLLRSTALALGHHLEWPQARLDAAKAESERLMQDPILQLDAADPLGCPSLHRQLDHLERVGRMGEIGALRNAPRNPPR